jgi:hypothetical protein
VNWIHMTNDSKSGGCCERGNEHLGSVRCEELIDSLRNR